MNIQECNNLKSKLIAEKASTETKIAALEAEINKVAKEQGVEPTEEALKSKLQEITSKKEELEKVLEVAIQEYNKLDNGTI